MDPDVVSSLAGAFGQHVGVALSIRSECTEIAVGVSEESCGKVTGGGVS